MRPLFYPNFVLVAILNYTKENKGVVCINVLNIFRKLFLKYELNYVFTRLRNARCCNNTLHCGICETSRDFYFNFRLWN